MNSEGPAAGCSRDVSHRPIRRMRADERPPGQTEDHDGFHKVDGRSWQSVQRSHTNLLVLSKRVPWYGGHSGYYEMLPRSLVQTGAPVSIVTPRPGLFSRLLGKFWTAWNGLPPRDQNASEAEWRFLRQFRRGGAHGLILAIEDYLPLLAAPFFSSLKTTHMTGVIHYPAALWNAGMLALLRRLDSALVLYRSDIDFFEEHLGKGRVRFAPHGVDTQFFRPKASAQNSSAAPRLLLSGQFGRDFKVLLEVFRQLVLRVPGISLDIVGAHHAAKFTEVRELATLPGVLVHPKLSDEALLALYQTASVLVLPLQACGANNALVEALSCGLPIVATDTGGVRDYGGGNLFPIVPREDAAAMANEVEALLCDAARRQTISRNIRAYAERELPWLTSAHAHLEALRELSGDRTA